MLTGIFRGALFLAAVAGLSASGADEVQATPVYRVIHAFTEPRDGNGPNDGLVIDASGDLIGTTALTGKRCCGTVFRVSLDGDETVLHRFEELDGDGPSSGLLQDRAGTLYGTTRGGGVGCRCGTIFKMAPDGTETLLYSFLNNGYDGYGPLGKPVADRAGNLYGVTSAGIGCGPCGMVFKLAPDGTETTLKYFNPTVDGGIPDPGLIIDRAGNLYGTTQYGGNQGCAGLGCGVVFKLAPDGTETVLHTFINDGSDGFNPYNDGVVLGHLGNLHGATSYGGKYGWGVVYEIAADGTYSILHNFQGGNDGAVPEGSLILDKLGNVYGTTTTGGGTGCGGGGCGTVFKLSPKGVETILHRFGQGAEGYHPSGSLTMSADGHLYGTTFFGPRAHGHGVVFEITP
jgi:uncharacterized repeat protein (TIGR03803 family)